MGDLHIPEKCSKESTDSELLNAGKAQGFEEMFQGIRSDPRAFIHRARKSLWKPSPQLQDSLQRTTSDIVFWMQKGSPWRAFLVSSVGVVLLLGLAGLGTFTLFFLAATLNAIAIGFLASIAVVGAFAAVFFTTLTAIYIGALAVAFATISTVTFLCICAALTGAGWIAFGWAVWQGLTKGVGLVKDLVTGLGSTSKRPPVTSVGEGRYVSDKDKWAA